MTKGVKGMNRREKYIFFKVCFEFIVGCILMIFYLLGKPDTLQKDLCFAGCLIAFFLAVLNIINNEHMGKKVYSVVKTVAGFVFDISIGLVIKVFDALLNISSNSRGDRLVNITGYKDNVLKVRADKKKKRARFKNWKNMDNKERVRFLYYKTVTGAIKKGYRFKKWETPNETGEGMIKGRYVKPEKQLVVECYNETRYNDNAVVSHEIVEKLRGIKK